MGFLTVLIVCTKISKQNIYEFIDDMGILIEPQALSMLDFDGVSRFLLEKE